MLPVQQEAAQVDWSLLAGGGKSAKYWDYATELQTERGGQGEQLRPNFSHLL